MPHSARVDRARLLLPVLVLVLLALTLPPAGAAPAPREDAAGRLSAPERTRISYLHLPSGRWYGTAGEHEPRAGLSIVKLYIADVVFRRGDASDAAKASRMLRHSDDALATELYARYPGSIAATALRYGLGDTRAATRWGDSLTSAHDTVAFLAAKLREDPAGPVPAAMAAAAPVAADGYRQDYGTATLPGVIGSKWGWSDDRRSHHASASYGSDFIVAAFTDGTREQHTRDVRGAFRVDAPAPAGARSVVPGLPAPGSPMPADLLPPLPVPAPGARLPAPSPGVPLPGPSPLPPVPSPVLSAVRFAAVQPPARG